MYRQFCFHLRRFRDRHRILCVLTVIAFVSSSMGLPLKPVGSRTSGCRCEDCTGEGGCGCCRPRDAAGNAGEEQPSCCSKVALKSNCCTLSASVSCCSKPPSANCCSKQADAPPPAKSCCNDSGKQAPKMPQPAGWNACTCGATIAFDMLINTEPRLLTPLQQTAPASENGQAVVLSDHPPLQHALLPETPPPERAAI